MKKSFNDYLNSLKGTAVAVIGAGISNTPLIDALVNAGVGTTIRDKRTREQLGDEAQRFEKMGARLVLGERYLDNIDEEVIFRTPGLMPHHPSLMKAVESGATLTSEMEVFFELCPCLKIGITGSDGKTTTTAIIADMLVRGGKTVHVGGNIGTPLLCRVDEIGASDIAVLELSSFQLITMRQSPEIAIITNITPNHLDVHKDLDEYIQAKRNIYLHQKRSDGLVLNADNEMTRGFAETAAATDVRLFSMIDKIECGTYLNNDKIVLTGKFLNHAAGPDALNAPQSEVKKIMQATDILLPGEHNIANYLAACAAVSGIVGIDAMIKTAREFTGVQHRLELVRELRGVCYYNDSIASSPTRTIAGLHSFDRKVILIAGGKDKGLSFEQLGGEINKRVKKLVLTGAAAEQIFDAVKNAPEYDGSLDIVCCDGFEDAVLEASKAASDGDIVLLSPACTSFDRFKNFEERGNLFREIVNSIS